MTRLSKAFFKQHYRTFLRATVLILLLATILWDPLLQSPMEVAQRWLTKDYPSLLSSTQLQNLYQSLINGYWVPQTGVFLSFPRTSDLRLTQQAATYDQGVAGLLLLRLGDKEKVQSILKFYEDAWDESGHRSGPRRGRKGYANFYNAYFRVEGVEKTMHVGPNAWIGLLAARYHRQTHDAAALKLAQDIAQWMIHKVPHKNGAIAMGEMAWNSTPWNKIYSTENNLSTYAFLTDLLKSDDLDVQNRQEIESEREDIATWLVKDAYNIKTGKVLRGFHWKGPDPIGAIDSYSWYLSALRPDYLYSHGIPTDHLLQVANKNFIVKVGDLRGIDAIDQKMATATYRDDVLVRKTKDPLFLRPAHDHHRLLWYEGQGQYILTLQDMARDATQRAFTRPEPERQRLLAQAIQWLQLAENLTQWMDKASFQQPFGPVYPSASRGRFYLWGWPAPASMNNHPADAVAPLVWRMLSGMGYEPLSDTQINPTYRVDVKLIHMHFQNPETDLLYGASEEMVVRAWQLYEEGRQTHAIRQARATIALWEKEAIALEKLKEKQVGGYLPYETGNLEQFQKIHTYWALNDVAAAYFIIGKIESDRKDYPKAVQAFSMLLKNYRLAQMWDQRGWFWNPVESIQMDYASADEKHYGALNDILYPPTKHRGFFSFFRRASS